MADQAREASPQKAPSSQALIDGRYRLLRLIGMGGMGSVYEAEHAIIGKRLALKIMHPQFSQYPDLVERLRREAQAASRIGHPNIVDVSDFGRTPDGCAYLAMEFLDGVDLATVLRSEGRLTQGRTINVGLQLARALGAAHRAGIVHRDLKPENIFLVRAAPGSTGGSAGHTSSKAQDAGASSTGLAPISPQVLMDWVKVLDFGVAAHLDLAEPSSDPGAPRWREPLTTPDGPRLTHPGLAIGTPEYMAPEQATEQTVDARADVYALGVVLYECLAGQVPFQGENAQTLLARKQAGTLPLPALPGETLHGEVARLLQRCLSPRAADRPQWMEEVEQVLTQAAAELGLIIDLSSSGLFGPVSQRFARITLEPGLSVEALGDVRARPTPESAGSPVPAFEISARTSDSLSQQVTASMPPVAARPRRWLWPAVTGAALVAVGFASAGALLSRHHDRPPAAAMQDPRPRPPRVQPMAPPPDGAQMGDTMRGQVPMLLDWTRQAMTAGRLHAPKGDNASELLARLERVAPTHPALPALYADLAAALIQQGKDELRRHQALEAHRTLLGLHEVVARSEGRLAASHALFPMQALVQELLFVARTGRPGHPKMFAAAKAAVALQPDSAAAQLVLAQQLLAQGKRAAAHAAYRRVLSLHPRDPERRLALQALQGPNQRKTSTNSR